MKNCIFTLEDGQAEGERPQVIKEAFQVFECTWNSALEGAFADKAGCLEGYKPPYRNFNGITSMHGAHFILNIDKILIKEKYYNSIKFCETLLPLKIFCAVLELFLHSKIIA